MAEQSLLLLKDYPYQVVRFACIRCDRQGRFSKSKLIAEHGPGAAMIDLRCTVSGCVAHRGKPCGAYYPDLVGG